LDSPNWPQEFATTVGVARKRGLASFLPDGDLIYRANRGGKNYLYTKKQDGSGERKLVNEPILDVETLSPDGKWVVATRSDNEDEEHPYRVLAYQPGKEHAVVLLPDALFCGLGGKRRPHVFSILGAQDANSYFLQRKVRGLPKLRQRILGAQELRLTQCARPIPRSAAGNAALTSNRIATELTFRSFHPMRAQCADRFVGTAAKR